jgi:hypothetical protein
MLPLAFTLQQAHNRDIFHSSIVKRLRNNLIHFRDNYFSFLTHGTSQFGFRTGSRHLHQSS